MNTQANKIRSKLNSEGWEIVDVESPNSKQYWWLWELWTLQKDGAKLFLSFLVDPQLEKSESNVWAVSANTFEPNERLEAENGIMLTIGKGWEKRLSEFVTKIKNTYEVT